VNAGHIAGARPAGGDDRQPPDRPLPDLARLPVFTGAAVLAVVLVATSGRYGYHRDELYFLASGRHLACGYPDQPPFVPLIARLMSDVASTSLVVLRLPSALAAAAVVAVTGLLTRELGGRRGAQLLAATSIAVAAVVDASGHTLNTNVFDLLVWALLCWLIVRILRTGADRLWLAVGLLAGLGLMDSDLVAFLMFAVVVGLAVAGPRRPFTSRWLYAGGLLAVLMWTPYLAWQASHGWAELAVARSIAGGGSIGAALGAAAGAARAGQPVRRAGLDRGPGAAAARPRAALVPRARRRLLRARRGVHRHRREAVLPRWHLRAAAGGRCPAGHRVAAPRAPARTPSAARRGGPTQPHRGARHAAAGPRRGPAQHAGRQAELRRRRDDRLAGIRS
jgi:hypothetical protein